MPSKYTPHPRVFVPPEVRFWSKTTQGALPVEWIAAAEDLQGSSVPCLLWTGALTSRGYGSFLWEGKAQSAHKVAYFLHHHEWPTTGNELNHKCRNVICVQWQHIEQITGTEHRQVSLSALKTECKRGHPFDEENTYRTSAGRRVCRRCTADAQSDYQLSRQYGVDKELLPTLRAQLGLKSRDS